MDQIIKDVVKAYTQAIPKSKFKCEIELKGSCITGNYSYGLFRKKKEDIGDINLIGDDRFLILDLQDEIENKKDNRNLPPYRFLLSFDHKGVFHYEPSYPNLDFSSLESIQKDPSGFYPDYLYINLSKELISQLDNFSINQIIPLHVEWARKVLGFESDVKYSKSISEEFYLQMLNINVQSEIENGEFDQLYSNFDEFPTSIISDLYKSFLLLNNVDVILLIEESIQLYSHFHKNVDEARQLLGIESIEKKTESDIMDRYYKLSPDLDEIRAVYIRANPDKFCTILIKD